MSEPSRNDFYARVPVFTRFADVLDAALYEPLPGDWHVGITDVVSSTEAIAAGRYKLVNTVGASIIAAMTNALEGGPFPFVFGGDGASFAIPGAKADLARTALAATAAWARDECRLVLRTALVPLAAIRAAGRDVRVARFAASSSATYAMFSGGGLAWAEGEVKAGRFGIAPAAAGTRPDLAGLSCRWSEMRAGRGLILSVIVLPVSGEADPAFRGLVGEILSSLSDLDGVGAGRPVPAQGPEARFSDEGIAIEAGPVASGAAPAWLRRLGLYLYVAAGFAVFRLGLPVGGFDPVRYRREVAVNADFRKYDDGLRMTLDCTPDFADRLAARLMQAEKDGIARFGLHRQDAAIMTCFVPSLSRGEHLHFIDGASGGYAAAAARLKALQAKEEIGAGTHRRITVK